MAAKIDFLNLVKLLQARASGRLIVGMAGAPGSGKSTIAEKIERALNVADPGTAAILPMDGFHFDDQVLNLLGRRARKGAPDTFDVGGFRHALMRLRDNSEDEIAVPVFDRTLEVSRGSARLIPKNIPVIIVEGNYLLLRGTPWNALKPLFDMTVFIDAESASLRRRLTARWQGLAIPPDEIARKVDENDMPNGHMVISESAEPDYVLSNS